jgi:hypothetical protein
MPTPDLGFELSTLASARRLSPFPTGANWGKSMKAHISKKNSTFNEFVEFSSAEVEAPYN